MFLTSPSADQEPGVVCLFCAACTVRASADVFLSVASAPRVSRRKSLRCVLTGPCRQVFTETQHMQTERRTGLRLQGSRDGMVCAACRITLVFDPAVIDVTTPHRPAYPRVPCVDTQPPAYYPWLPSGDAPLPHSRPSLPLCRVLKHQRETWRSVDPTPTA